MGGAWGAFAGLDAWLRRLPMRERTAVAGLWAWIVTGVLPLVHRRALLPTSAFLLLLLSPACFGVGLALLRRRAPFAPYALLSLVPLSLALPPCCLGHELGLTTFSLASVVLSLGGLAAYLAAAATWCGEVELRYPSQHRSLEQGPRQANGLRKQRLGDILVMAMALGTTLAVTLGALGTPASFRQHWKEAAPEGAVLTAVSAGIVGAIAIVLVGPYLRAARPNDPREPSRSTRILAAALWIASGLAVYFFSRT